MGLRASFYRRERLWILLYLAFLGLLLAAFCSWLFRKRYSYALEKFLLERYETPWESRYGRARKLWGAGDLAGAERAYERIAASVPADQIRLRLAPIKVKTLRDLGEVYLAQGKQRRALDTFTELVAFDPRNYFHYYRLALCHKARGETDEALNALSEALNINPNYREAFETRIALLHEAGRHEDAIRRYREYMDALFVIQGRVYFMDESGFDHEKRVEIENVLVDAKSHTYTVPLYGNEAWHGAGTVTGLRLDLHSENPGMDALVVRIGAVNLLGPKRVGNDEIRNLVSFSKDFANREASRNAVFLSPDLIRAEGKSVWFLLKATVKPAEIDAMEIRLTAYKPLGWETVLILGDCYRQQARLDEEKAFFEGLRERFPNRSADPFTPDFLLPEDASGEGSQAT